MLQTICDDDDEEMREMRDGMRFARCDLPELRCQAHGVVGSVGFARHAGNGCCPWHTGGCHRSWNAHASHTARQADYSRRAHTSRHANRSRRSHASRHARQTEHIERIRRFRTARRKQDGSLLCDSILHKAGRSFLHAFAVQGLAGWNAHPRPFLGFASGSSC